jgi:glycine hydroxymethyltransferase
VTSGIRIGTAAATTRGMDENAMREIAVIIGQAIKSPKDTAVHAQLKSRVHALTGKFPLYAALTPQFN